MYTYIVISVDYKSFYFEDFNVLQFLLHSGLLNIKYIYKGLDRKDYCIMTKDDIIKEFLYE